jgi:hypothetical protein
MARINALMLIKAIAVTAAATLAVSTVSFADTPSPFVGTWVLNVAKSTFDPPPPLKSNTTTTTEVAGGGLHTVINIVEADGSKTHLEYTIPPGGGKAAPVTGSEYADSILLTQINSRKLKYVLTKAGATVESGTYTISKGGKIMKGRLSGTYDKALWKAHFVYDRQ